MAHFMLKEWTHMLTAPIDIEVGHTKSQLKARLLLGLNGTTTVAEDIGRQLITSVDSNHHIAYHTQHIYMHTLCIR